MGAAVPTNNTGLIQDQPNDQKKDVHHYFSFGYNPCFGVFDLDLCTKRDLPDHSGKPL